MKVEVLTERENPLLKRKEVEALVEHVGKATPSRAELRKVFAEQYGVPIEHVIVVKIRTRYGTNKSFVRCHLYEDLSVAKVVEHKHLLRKHEGEKGGGSSEAEEKA